MEDRNFGSKVKYHRIRQGMTQRELGKKLGVTQVTIANYERGLRFPKESILKAMGEQLSISLDELFFNKIINDAGDSRNDYNIENYLHILLKESLEESWNYLWSWKMKSLMTTEKIFYTVFIPLLKLLGDEWAQKKIIISQEHLVSEKIKILIVWLIKDEMKTSHIIPDNNKRWMGLCAPNEQHELVLFMASQIMRLKGWDVYYLGKNVPQMDLMKMLNRVNPQVLVISITMAENKSILQKYLRDLILQEKRRIIVGGKGINAKDFHSYSQEIIYSRTLKDTIGKSLIYKDKEVKNE